MADARDSDEALERLRRWSQAPTEASPEKAAAAVRQRIAARRSAARRGAARRWSWLAAAMVALGLVGLWALRPPDPLPGVGEKPVASSVADSGSLVIVPLASGTTLYIAPRFQGEIDEKNPR